MKKIIVSLLSVVLLLTLTVLSVSAAGDINANEQRVLNKLTTVVQVGQSKIIIPTSYINQARNYFMTIDMSEAEADEIVKILDQGIAVGRAELEAAGKNGRILNNVNQMPYASKAKILSLGQQACAVINLTLTYVPENNTVVITENATGKVVFDATPALKTTGGNGSLVPLYVAAGVLVLAVAGAIVYKKRVTA